MNSRKEEKEEERIGGLLSGLGRKNWKEVRKKVSEACEEVR